MAHPIQVPPNVRLVQLDLSPPEIPPLPSPPLLTSWLFEKPIPLALVVIGLSIIAFVLLNRGGRGTQGLIVGAIGFVLAAVAWATSTAVVTPREELKAHATRLVDRVAAGDGAGVRDLLADRAEMSGLGFVPEADREGIVRAVDRWIGSNPVRDYDILDHRASVDGPNTGRTQLRVRVVATTGATVGWFEIAWYLHPEDGWQVARITPIWIQGVPS